MSDNQFCLRQEKTTLKRKLNFHFQNVKIQQLCHIKRFNHKLICTRRTNDYNVGKRDKRHVVKYFLKGIEYRVLL